MRFSGGGSASYIVVGLWYVGIWPGPAHVKLADEKWVQKVEAVEREKERLRWESAELGHRVDCKKFFMG